MVGVGELYRVGSETAKLFCPNIVVLERDTTRWHDGTVGRAFDLKFIGQSIYQSVNQSWIYIAYKRKASNAMPLRSWV